MMNFSVFSKHQSGVHTFNPTLDCNIQILSEKIINNKKIEGVTFSGGEPLDQAEVLFELGKNQALVTNELILKVGPATCNNKKTSVMTEVL